jgi:hypothetical protein
VASNSSHIAKAGIGILKRLVFDEQTLEADNRRREDRAPVAGEVDVAVMSAQGETLFNTRVFIRDISKKGCGLWSRAAMPAGAQVLITFARVGPNPATQRMGNVCHCRGQAGSGFAIGIRFVGDAQPVR